MPEYSKSSQDKLDTCHIDLQVLCSEVILTTDHTVVCGTRSMEDQNRAYVEGNSTVQWPDSKHNKYPSRAVDLAPYFVEINAIDWNDIRAFYLFAGRVLETADRLFAEGVMSHKIRYGGDWDGDGMTSDQTFIDAGHFELVDGG